MCSFPRVIPAKAGIQSPVLHDHAAYSSDPILSSGSYLIVKWRPFWIPAFGHVEKPGRQECLPHSRLWKFMSLSGADTPVSASKRRKRGFSTSPFAGMTRQWRRARRGGLNLFLISLEALRNPILTGTPLLSGCIRGFHTISALRISIRLLAAVSLVTLICLPGSSHRGEVSAAPENSAIGPDSSRRITPDKPSEAGVLADSNWLGTVPWPPRPIRNFSFGVGETLLYDIGWQSIVAGRGQMTVGQPVDTNGHLCFPIVSTVESSPFFSTFYRVDDSAISFMDVRQLYPIRFEKYLREGKYRSDQIAEFDPTTGKAYTPKDTIPVPPYVQDALSLLYYVRTLDLKPDTELTLENFTGKKTYTLTVRVLHRERIEVKAGTFSTIVVEPLLQAAGLFKQEGKLKVWLTDDRLHLPVLMKTKVLVGSIVAELTDYRLGTVRRYSP